jgi:hypothetical protein
MASASACVTWEGARVSLRAKLRTGLSLGFTGADAGFQDHGFISEMGGDLMCDARRRLLQQALGVGAAVLTLALPRAARPQASHTESLDIGGASIMIVFPAGDSQARRRAVLAWVARSAQAVTTYFGRFPVKQVHVLVSSSADGGIHGRTHGRPRAFILAPIGRDVDHDRLIGSWVMTHEMVHLAFPSVPDRHNWMHEGIATYVEPIAQAQAGMLPVTRVWAQLVEGLPHGLPGPGDRGLDYTPTWGRTYWGGCLFYLLADIEIRTRTGNAGGLQDALRAIVEAGGTFEVEWSAQKTLEIGDRATRTTVLRDLYGAMHAAPVHTDLGELWRRLGVRVQGADVQFDEMAPLTALRAAITRTPEQPARVAP